MGLQNEDGRAAKGVNFGMPGLFYELFTHVFVSTISQEEVMKTL